MKYSLSASDIQSVLSASRPKHSNNLKIFTLPSDVLGVGFALGRWSGSSVERSRFKRVSRETIKKIYKNKQPANILIQTKNKINLISSVENEIICLLAKADLKKRK